MKTQDDLEQSEWMHRRSRRVITSGLRKDITTKTDLTEPQTLQEERMLLKTNIQTALLTNNNTIQGNIVK